MSDVRHFWFFIPYSPQEDTRPGAKLAYTRLVGGLLCTLFARGGGCGARKPGLYNGLLGVVGGVPPPLLWVFQGTTALARHPLVLANTDNEQRPLTA
jgi:hypothetical protein